MGSYKSFMRKKRLFAEGKIKAKPGPTFEAKTTAITYYSRPDKLGKQKKVRFIFD